MERTELTLFIYSSRGICRCGSISSLLLIISTIPGGRDVEEEKREADDHWVTAYVVNNVYVARLFLDHYSIEYKEKPDGKIQVKAPREIDQEHAHNLNQRLHRAHLAKLCDHEFIWHDRDRNMLVTYSPYDVEEVKQTWIEKVENNFYGHRSTTYIMQC